MAFGSALPCERVIAARVDYRLQKVLDDEKTPSQLRKQLRKNLDKIRAEVAVRVARKCPTLTDCTPDELEKIVSTTVDKSLAVKGGGINWKTISAYVGSLGGWAMIMLFLRNTLPADMALVLGSSLGLVTGQLINALGLPVMSWLTGRIGRWSSQGSTGETMEPMRFTEEYEAVYRKTLASVTLNAQAGRGIVRNDLTFAKMSFIGAAQVCLADEEKGMRIATGAFAQLLLDLTDAYPEVDLETEPLFMKWAHRWFGDHFVTSESYARFTEGILATVVADDARVAGSEPLQQKFRRVLFQWFHPSTRPLSADSEPTIDDELDGHRA